MSRVPFIPAKGFIGLGGGSGHMNDEDWAIPPGIVGPFFVPYSNTLSGKVDDTIKYGTIDAGYDWMRGPSYKVASFVGYNVLNAHMKAFGCQQIADPFSDCSAANPLNPPSPTTVLGITEKDEWQSLRLGTSADVMLTPWLKLSGDAAYLPRVWFSGTDNHVARGVVFPETGTGTGVQLEASLSYYLTDQFSIGGGVRYWAMRTTDGSYSMSGNPGCCGPAEYKVEQAAWYLQGTYKLGDGREFDPLK